MKEKPKFFVFSDESGSWHNIKDIYVRSWIVVGEEDELQLSIKINQIIQLLDTNELSWKIILNHEQYFSYFDNINFKIFITVSSPKDINWNRFSLIKNFDFSISNFDFGKLEQDLIDYIKNRVFRDIKNALFLNFYEKHHIENAKKVIEKIIRPIDHELIYRIDPPQLPISDWKSILNKISGKEVDLEFPKSERSHGIQFADIVAGCFRSFLIMDNHCNVSSRFLKTIRRKLIQRNTIIPNPNFIFFKEINSKLNDRFQEIWII